MHREAIPRLPVFGWQALKGGRAGPAPCLLGLPGLRYTTSGRAAILIALEALGVGPGDEVLLPTFHCPTMVAPANSLGAAVRFYPIDAQGTPDLAWLEGQDLRQVRVMLAAHYFGLPQPMFKIQRWCETRGIALIEDCAHALFGHVGGRPVGAWGDIAIASLTKFLPVPEGGCMIVNRGSVKANLLPCGLTTQISAALDILEVGATQRSLPGLNSFISLGLAGVRVLRGKKLSTLRSAALLDASIVGTEAGGPDLTIDARLAHRQLAWPCRLVAESLPRERIIRRRRDNYELLARLFTGVKGMKPLRPDLPTDCAPYVFPLWVDHPDPGYIELLRQLMPVARWDRLWPGVPKLPDDHGRLWSHHVFQLSCHQDLEQEQLHRLARNITAACTEGPTAC